MSCAEQLAIAGDQPADANSECLQSWQALAGSTLSGVEGVLQLEDFRVSPLLEDQS
eukprot:CAMPEP_0206437514 /NCGR_PEP_ID=MMETSP0324_2-20121206/11087_1 /ASSEMBLY_ACC=CAM_ASM_000836 /TAXON_ID=2866 /ORGANISM="Crypthecodinium cohnii, Strain Seligo" /LENGTH=55 /DNA_ID=CAMNT_0053904811 /DNA_START=279 /DNA_END=446 /DNA_ORIENTATION=-